MLQKKRFQDIDAEKKNVLLRIDIDSSFENGAFLEPQKIERYKKTLEYLMTDRKNKVLVLFEHGKNRMIHNEALPASVLMPAIVEILDMEISFFTRGSDKNAAHAIEEILPGEVLFWENLALFPKKEATHFDKMEEWADFYINDAFGSSSRPDYSFNELPEKLDSFPGFLMQDEVEELTKIFSSLEEPFTLIMGGIDIDPFMLESLPLLTEKADHVLFAGAWVSYYAHLQGQIEKEEWMDKKTIRTIEKALENVHEKENVSFPEDVKVYKQYEDDSVKIANVPIDFIKKGLTIGDIGIDSLERYSEIIKNSKTVLWIGSVGKWWLEELNHGTLELAEVISSSYSKKLLLGDDLIESLNHCDYDDFYRFDNIHFGNGEAVFNFLLQKEIPGFSKLKNAWNL